MIQVMSNAGHILHGHGGKHRLALSDVELLGLGRVVPTGGSLLLCDVCVLSIS